MAVLVDLGYNPKKVEGMELQAVNFINITFLN